MQRNSFLMDVPIKGLQHPMRTHTHTQHLHREMKHLSMTSSGQVLGTSTLLLKTPFYMYSCMDGGNLRSPIYLAT